MRYSIVYTAAAAAFFALAPAAWSQMVPDPNPALAPARNPAHPTSTESLTAQAQELTKKIDQAKAQGRDTSVASAEQSQGEMAMQQGKSQDAVRHFQAGEQSLNTGQSTYK
ncbi:MAG TPA: hypothetical protein VKB84_06990 [Candidatus Binataceae bacterium]|jgi:hypothetical protein|nr:hypothetical protein [Candidatus Binataceae bacterium]